MLFDFELCLDTYYSIVANLTVCYKFLEQEKIIIVREVLVTSDI